MLIGLRPLWARGIMENEVNRVVPGGQGSETDEHGSGHKSHSFGVRLSIDKSDDCRSSLIEVTHDPIRSSCSAVVMSQQSTEESSAAEATDSGAALRTNSGGGPAAAAEMVRLPRPWCWRRSLKDRRQPSGLAPGGHS